MFEVKNSTIDRGVRDAAVSAAPKTTATNVGPDDSINLSSTSFGAKLRSGMDTFLDKKLSQQPGETIGGSLRQEYLFAASFCLSASTLWYPAVEAVSRGDWVEGGAALLMAGAALVLEPVLYASYLRDTGRMKPGSIWSKLVPRDNGDGSDLQGNSKLP